MKATIHRFKLRDFEGFLKDQLYRDGAEAVQGQQRDKLGQKAITLSAICYLSRTASVEYEELGGLFRLVQAVTQK